MCQNTTRDFVFSRPKIGGGAVNQEKNLVDVEGLRVCEQAWGYNTLQLTLRQTLRFEAKWSLLNGNGHIHHSIKRHHSIIICSWWKSEDTYLMNMLSESTQTTTPQVLRRTWVTISIHLFRLRDSRRKGQMRNDRLRKKTLENLQESCQRIYAPI